MPYHYIWVYRENSTSGQLKQLLNDISRRVNPLNASGCSIDKEYSSKKSLSEIFKMAASIW